MYFTLKIVLTVVIVHFVPRVLVAKIVFDVPISLVNSIVFSMKNSKNLCTNLG